MHYSVHFYVDDNMASFLLTYRHLGIFPNDLLVWCFMFLSILGIQPSSHSGAIPSGDANMRSGRFQEDLPTGISLAGKTIGIIRLGRLGSYMASYCRALNMTVVAWSDNLTVEQAQAGWFHFGFETGVLVGLRCGQHPSRAVIALARAIGALDVAI
jgi:hypothetical protein